MPSKEEIVFHDQSRFIDYGLLSKIHDDSPYAIFIDPVKDFDTAQLTKKVNMMISHSGFFGNLADHKPAHKNYELLFLYESAMQVVGHALDKDQSFSKSWGDIFKFQKPLMLREIILYELFEPYIKNKIDDKIYKPNENDISKSLFKGQRLVDLVTLGKHSYGFWLEKGHTIDFAKERKKYSRLVG